MAITLNDLVERIEDTKTEIINMNFGDAARKLDNLSILLRDRGVVIHAIATMESKKVDGNDSQEN